MGFKKTSGNYGTSRDDPIKAAFGWRQKMDFRLIENVQNNKICQKVMNKLGYLKLEEKDLKNSSTFSLDPFWSFLI